MGLPLFQTAMRELSMLQTRWKSTIDPILDSAPNNCLVLKSVALVTGANVVNHKLGRNLQGWKLVRQRSAGSVYDTQDANQTPDLTLQLVSSANMVVDIEVF